MGLTSAASVAAASPTTSPVIVRVPSGTSTRAPRFGAVIPGGTA